MSQHSLASPPVIGLVGAKHAGHYQIHSKVPQHACFALPVTILSDYLFGFPVMGQGEACMLPCFPIAWVQACMLRPYQTVHRTCTERTPLITAGGDDAGY